MIIKLIHRKTNKIFNLTIEEFLSSSWKNYIIEYNCQNCGLLKRESSYNNYYNKIKNNKLFCSECSAKNTFIKKYGVNNPSKMNGINEIKIQKNKERAAVIRIKKYKEIINLDIIIKLINQKTNEIKIVTKKEFLNSNWKGWMWEFKCDICNKINIKKTYSFYLNQIMNDKFICFKCLKEIKNANNKM